jgi:hypothetical protein
LPLARDLMDLLVDHFGGLTDHEVYLVWMRIYAAIYGFMEFDPAKRITLETAFGATIQFPIAQLDRFPPVVHAWEKLVDF